MGLLGLLGLLSLRGIALAYIIASYSSSPLAEAAALTKTGTLAVPVRRGAPPGPSAPLPSLARRDGTVDVAALNNITGGGYYADLGIGTPPQTLTFLLDTGSSDTWVNTVDTDLCQSSQLQDDLDTGCTRQFDPQASSTFTALDRGAFDITYLDQKKIQGDYFNDTVTVNGKSVPGQKLGLALQSVRATGIMGLGFRDNVAARTPYPTVVESMVSAGVIESPVFSLFLNALDAKSGTILFGGVDSARYHGKLATLPLVSDVQTRSSNGTSYSVRLRGFSVDGVRLNDDLDAAAVIDSGSTISLLPDGQVQDLHRHFGVRNLQGVSIPLTDCAWRGDKGKGVAFNFRFDGVTVKVPVREMIVDAFPKETQRSLQNSELSRIFGDWKGVCIFGIASAADYGITSDNFALLGDTFMRSAYIVYDMANRQVGLAQANTKPDKSNVVAVRKGATTLPDVDGAPGTGQENAAVSDLASSSQAVLVAVLASLVASAVAVLS